MQHARVDPDYSIISYYAVYHRLLNKLLPRQPLNYHPVHRRIITFSSYPLAFPRTPREDQVGWSKDFEVSLDPAGALKWSAKWSADHDLEVMTIVSLAFEVRSLTRN
jgi:hypothetical protein